MQGHEESYWFKRDARNQIANPKIGARNRIMPRNYRAERNAIIQRWYGGDAPPKNRKPHRTLDDDTITPADFLGVPLPVNSPFRVLGHCMIWKYPLTHEGYGYLTIDGKRALAHRVVFIQTRGEIPEGMQVNHLCNRPYCVQTSHLYAGSKQDNKDDSQIFTKEELLHAPWIMDGFGKPSPDDLMLHRLLESNRYDGTEPWNPVEQPAQKPLEEFICPGHDFAITMFGGNSKICRICETSESQEKMIDEIGISELISEFCPVSRTVTPILSKIWASDFVRDRYREIRYKAYNRSHRPFWKGAHDLRSCECDYCTRDRQTFRKAIEPVLTEEESELLDTCNRLDAQIAAILEEAAGEIMEVWAKEEGLNNVQAQTLREHLKDCVNSQSSSFLGSELAYLLHALANFDTREEMIDDRASQANIYGLGLISVRKEDEEHIKRIISPVMGIVVNRISFAWERESDSLLRPYLETKPDLIRDLKSLARALTFKHVLECLRYELLGRNSSAEQEPHPHSSCVASIRATGRVQSHLSELQEGMGYKPYTEEDSRGHFTVRTTAVDIDV